MSTPEGKVKEAVKELLCEFRLVPAAKAPNVTEDHTGWFFMPVSNGMGVHGIPDFIGHHFGQFFSVETKGDEQKEPTALQKHQIKAIITTGGANFVIKSVDQLGALNAWLSANCKEDSL